MVAQVARPNDDEERASSGADWNSTSVAARYMSLCTERRKTPVISTQLADTEVQGVDWGNKTG